MLTGAAPAQHGIVGNGWYWRETGEVRFWLQANRLIEADPVYVTARRRAAERGEQFTCAKLFWWFNQGAAVDWSVTPKPHYGADGSKEFGIHGTPDDLAPSLERTLGPFPFHSFWGPRAGLACSEWIAAAAGAVMRRHRPTLTLVYLPHLDDDQQRFGPEPAVVARCLAEIDRCAGVVIDAAREIGAKIVVVSEYGLVPVRQPVFLNRVLREAGWLAVRTGPFGEMLDTFASQAFAVCDHQIAHVYLTPQDRRDKPGGSLIDSVAQRLRATPGVSRVLDRAGQRQFELDHPRSGDLVVLSERDAWFAYPYWLDDALTPDFARTVDIHRKPGYDPCELFVDPQLHWPKLHIARRLAEKKLGFRYLMDVVPLDATLVRGSHGLPPADPQDGPVIITDAVDELPPARMVDLKDWLLRRMGLA